MRTGGWRSVGCCVGTAVLAILMALSLCSCGENSDSKGGLAKVQGDKGSFETAAPKRTPIKNEKTRDELSTAENEKTEGEAEEKTEEKTEESGYDVKYAVALYGIEQDEYEGGNGNKAGLTFGPATGENYVSSSHSHTPSGQTYAGNDHRCLHTDDWNTIIRWSEDDPYVYEQCIREGCTHSVKLNFPQGSKIKGMSYKGRMDQGDGASVLFDSIEENYQRWNYESTTCGGWPASRIRAVLNGPNVNMADGIDVVVPEGSYNYVADGCEEVAGAHMADFTDADALISAFPAELQAAIVAKAVKSDTEIDNLTSCNITTYDRLWLFSNREIYKAERGSYGLIRPNEGDIYQKAEEQNIFCNVGADQPKGVGCKEDGSSYEWWLRSPYPHNSSAAFGVSSSGDWCGLEVSGSCGIAPGFSIK